MSRKCKKVLLYVNIKVQHMNIYCKCRSAGVYCTVYKCRYCIHRLVLTKVVLEQDTNTAAALLIKVANDRWAPFEIIEMTRVAPEELRLFEKALQVCESCWAARSSS